MMYYRRKIILAFLEIFGNDLGKIELQKLIFLFSQFQKSASFDFVPFKYGCYSYQIGWDLNALHKYGFLKEVEYRWVLIKTDNYLSSLTANDQINLKNIWRQFKSLSTEELMRYTYLTYPYYATKSKIAQELLDTNEFQKIKAAIPRKDKSILFTLGYEGISLEKYFNKLIINDVKVLCDVRRNPISQKVGFSKYTLKKVCESLEIIYIHIPELGIGSEKRQNLKTQKDYDLLFVDYEKNYLIHQSDAIYQIFHLMNAHKRVALTCFEAAFCQCHRGNVANALTKKPDWNYELIHL